MKHLVIAATAGFVALTGAASAMTEVGTVTANEIRSYAPEVDVDALTTAQINALKGTIHSGDSEAEKRAFVYSIVNG